MTAAIDMEEYLKILWVSLDIKLSFEKHRIEMLKKVNAKVAALSSWAAKSYP